MSKALLKKIGIYAGIVVLFIFLAYSFMPQLLSGKVVNQSDISGYSSMSHQATEWNKANPDDITHWTDSMFSGMPTTSFMPVSDGDWTQKLYNLLLTGKRPATYLFISLLGAFLLMLSLGIDTLLAVGGAIAVTFCSYNLQIIQVGHNTKMQALAFLPWALAAVIFTYRSALKKGKGWKSWLPATSLGAVLFGFAMSMQIKANHQQITYYLALILVAYVVTLFIWLLCSCERRAKIGRFFAASALLLVTGLSGIGTNTIKLAPLYEYTAYTMRGGSELSSAAGSSAGEVNDKGLQLDYATAWSYGWEELPNLMIPNFNGGSSAGSIDPDKSATVQLFKDAGQGNPYEIAKALPFYWGPQPFTAGPMYMGAITVFLFLLGLFLYKGKEKWWMLAATILAVFLGVGNHMMWFTRLFFNYAPMYNKFRTVSMALVILQFTLPMLGFLTLDRIMKQEYSKKEIISKGWPALALSAGFCLVLALIPSLAGSFSSASDSRMQDVLVEAIRTDRAFLLKTDAFWSMLLILASAILILWAVSVPKKAQKTYEQDPHIRSARVAEASLAICILVLMNMFTVGHRYLNKSHFTTPRAFSAQFDKRPVDEAILSDPALSYRVADLTCDIFNDSFNGYWHKSVGGYSPAKLQRYQDLIDTYLRGELSAVVGSLKDVKTISEAESMLAQTPLLSALNCKYFIISGESAPIVNRNAFGNAWFVDSVTGAATPDEELAAAGSIDLRHQAVISNEFESLRDDALKAVSGRELSPADTIVMTSYSPKKLTYHYRAASDRPAVFSEVYYPKGWKAEVDGQSIDIFRCNWIFRGIVLPAGEHDVTMTFEPDIYHTSKAVSTWSSLVLIILLLASAAGAIFIKKEKETE